MQKKKRGLYREHSTYHGVAYDITAKTKPELREKVRRRQNEIDAGFITKDTLVKDWASRWLETYEKPRLTQRELTSKRGIVNHYIVPAIGLMKVSSVRAAHLQEILNELSERGLSQSTGRKILQVIRQMFRAARHNRIILEDPSEFIQLVGLRPGEHRRPLTHRERELIEQECYLHRGGLWVMLQLYCGLRPSEAAAIQKKDLDGKDVLHVEKSLTSARGEIKSPKSKAGVRDVPIPDKLKQFIREWKYWGALGPFDFIVTSLEGRPLKSSGQECVWRAMRREIDKNNGGVFYNNAIIKSVLPDDCTPYLLRHTYCTDLQAAGIPINVARELMGHADIQTTARIYTHSSVEATMNAAICLNRLNQTRSGTHSDSGKNTGT